MITYERYCADLIRFNQPITFTREEYEIKYSDPIKEEKKIETRRKEPTLKLSVSAPNASIKKPPKPVVVRSPRERDRSKEKPRNRTGRIMTPKVSYDGMSIEDIKSHKAKLAREWRAKRKEAGIKTVYAPITDVGREKKREYYLKNADKIKAKTKAYRQKICSTDAGREKASRRMREWRKNNPDRAVELSRTSKARCRERKLNGNNIKEG